MEELQGGMFTNPVQLMIIGPPQKKKLFSDENRNSGRHSYCSSSMVSDRPRTAWPARPPILPTSRPLSESSPGVTEGLMRSTTTVQLSEDRKIAIKKGTRACAPR